MSWCVGIPTSRLTAPGSHCRPHLKLACCANCVAPSHCRTYVRQPCRAGLTQVSHRLGMAAPVPAGLGMTSCWDPTDLPRPGDGSPYTSSTWYDELLGSPPTYCGLGMAAPVPAGLGMTSCWDPTDLLRAGDGSPCTSRTWYDELLGSHRPTAGWGWQPLYQQDLV